MSRFLLKFPDLLRRAAESLLRLDRRWIFLFISLGVIVSLVGPFSIEVSITTPTARYFSAIDRLPPGSTILVSMDLGPSTLPELEPILAATVRHALGRGLRVLAMTLLVEGPSIGERIMLEAAEELNAMLAEAGEEERITMGENWVFLGYRAGGGAVILQFGEELRKAYPSDFYGTPLEELPMMAGVRSFDDMGLVVAVSGTALPEAWISYAGVPFGIPVLVGCTAVYAPNYYAYLQTRQIEGMLGGLKGAAEYERLISRPAGATRGMVAQMTVHVLIVFLIVLGNVAYFISRGRKRAR
ncbi:MAG TPA: hypothetical protein ENN88_02760 [Candidatus Coatesbacteria bacterium]|nr:hypothetical protein [Candidatus Coatesbacteria bacterium]